MSRSRVVLVVLFCAALLTPVRAADATSSVLCTGYTSCSGKGYSHAGYSSAQHTSYWRMYTGTNCTNYVAYRLVKTNGMPNVRPKSGVGNARDWGTTMASITDSRPVAGSVAWWGRTGNHVAYVEKVVSSSEIWVSESNWSGAFDWRKITKSGSGWPDGFIHFADRSLINKAKPAIVGDVKVGRSLAASGGTWSPTGNTYAYQWLADAKVISGATGTRFTPTESLRGKDLSLRVTASRSGYPTVTATSPSITVEPGSVSNIAPPGIDGNPQVDVPISASTAGTWSPTGNTYRYQWLADGVKISGATTRKFTPGPAQAGKRLTFAVTASRSGYDSVTKTSDPSADVAPGRLSNTERPTVLGTPRVGSTLTASAGSWSKTGLSYAYQWSVDGKPVSGARASTYQPTAADIGLPVSVEVTASRAGYTSTRATSASSAAVAVGALTVKTRPSIIGTPRVGAALTARVGTWSAPAAYGYQWYANGKAVAGATARTFTPGPTLRGAKLYVRVSARQAGYTAGSAVSASTAAVAYGQIRFSKQPRITGTLSRGALVKLDPGTRTPAGARLRYQWLRDGKTLSGATGTSRRLSSADRGHLLSVRVTATASGYTQTVTTTVARRAAR